MDQRPIGFMDSGVGGLSVIKTAMQLLPNEELIFIGDEARMPYGPRPTSEVIEYSRQMAHFLMKKNIKALVIACNTATNAALTVLQEELSIPVLGVIVPGAEMAVEKTRNQKIGVIATIGTIKANAYPEELEKIDSQVEVFPLACQQFVEIVENNASEHPNSFNEVNSHLAALKAEKIDTLILGCTHFPLLSKAIKQAVGDEVVLIDPGVATVQQLKEVLSKNNLENELKLHDNQYYATGNLENFKEIAKSFLNTELDVSLAKID